MSHHGSEGDFVVMWCPVRKGLVVLLELHAIDRAKKLTLCLKRLARWKN